ncbi:dTDP-4-dehydrorhamnose reductase [Paraburkholderia dinghuensis]|uniref:dTDP-4-dehydrorhamnose reductase n=1 Tax=Paraburkholderia dinghuensis TaxID=2305225 RepID=A0A3N6MWJ8_9BURK|nr:dTDP-4-dehydrorhamnose reductase [Paraburkholderia dinghuensis]RQH08338.1 dTDP-4-dehydrorhamnose reductase [Paraburkholderia dinghuensis]
MQPKILVSGKNGQVGFELERALQGLGTIVALDRVALDLADFDQIRQVLREIKPALIVNPAAYTAVDRAETEPDLAQRINGDAPGVLAEEARRLGVPLIHYSTDYVFDGTKEGAYDETDKANPQSAYGLSKLAGERAIAEVDCAHVILRTSWVYGQRGKNFLLTMLRLAAERPELRIVEDQRGAPTWAATIAAMTSHIVAQGLVTNTDGADWWRQKSGVYHLTASGSTTWFDFANAIFELSSLENKPVVTPIASSEYPLPAKRPGNSCLSNEKLAASFGLRAPDWRDALRLCLAGLSA